jgi:hypothetical protein
MHLEGKVPPHILFLAHGLKNFEVGVKAHRGAGSRNVIVPRIHAFGETIDDILGKELSPEEVVLAAFSIHEKDPSIYVPQKGVHVEVYIPGEGNLLAKSGFIREVEERRITGKEN